MSEIDNSCSQQLTPKGMKTRQNLADTAEKIFGTKGFFNASIVEITHKAGVAQGTFYNYFSSKEDIFLEVFTRLINNFLAELKEETANPANAGEELAAKFRFFFRWVTKHRNLFSLINQMMLVNPEIYRWFFENTVNHHINGLREGIKSGEFKDLDLETMACCLTGIYAFIGWRWGYLEDKVAPDYVHKDIFEFVFHGLEQETGKHNDPEHVLAEMPKWPKTNSAGIQTLTSKGVETRKRLLDAAGEIYATKGYFNTSIVDITQKAGVAQGTFYVYFPSKQDIFVELVKQLCDNYRTELLKVTAEAASAKEELVLRLRFLFRWMKTHHNLFSLIEQAILVNEKLYRWFYEISVSSYIRVLQAGIDSGEFKALDTESMAYSLIGVTGFIGAHWIYLEDKEVPDYVLNDVVEFIFGGLRKKR